MKKQLLSCLVLLCVASDAYAGDGLKCLADNIYHEARGESVEGQRAVGFVTINRLFSDERGFNKRGSLDACDVVYYGTFDKNGAVRKHRCQFSWTCDGKSDDITDLESYARITELAQELLEDPDADNTNGALFYKTLSTDVAFKRPFAQTIGNHAFYY